MIYFCPNCGNILIIEEGANCFRLACSTCPFINNIDDKISKRKYCKLKEIDDVMGGEAAWENVDSTEITCEQCEHNRAYFMQIQTRSADEPMTTFYKCCKCGHRWKE